MLKDVLRFMRDQVNEYLVLTTTTPANEIVVLSNIVTNDPADEDNILMPMDNKIILSLIHLEEDRIFKGQDVWQQTPNGMQRQEPELKFNLYALFAARYDAANYETGLDRLSDVITYFQSNNVFSSATHNRLSPRYGKLIVDLYTQPLDKNYEFWQSLGGKFIPSVLYRCRVVVFRDQQVQGDGSRIIEINNNLNQI